MLLKKLLNSLFYENRGFAYLVQNHMFYYNFMLVVRAEIDFSILQTPVQDVVFFLYKACVWCVFHYNGFHFKKNLKVSDNVI